MLDLQWSGFNDPNEAFDELQNKINTVTNKYLRKRKMTKKEVKQSKNHG